MLTRPLIVVVVLSCAGSSVCAGTSLRAVQILTTGDGAPQLPGVSISSLEINDMSINETGEVAFTAPLFGDGVTSGNKFALFAGDPSSLSLVARSGDQFPGGIAGVRYWPSTVTPFATPGITDGGFVTISASLLDSGSIIGGLAAGPVNAPNAVAHAGMPSDEPIGLTYDAVYGRAGVTPGGATALRADLDTGSAINAGVWTKNDTTTTRVLYAGDVAPGLAGLSISNAPHLWGDDTVVNDLGQVALIAGVAGPGVTTSTDSVLFVGAPGALAPAVREGVSIPGAGAPSSLPNTSEDTVRINNAGAVVAYINVNGPVAIVSGTPGNVVTVARNGTQVPGQPPGANYSFFGAPELDGNGNVYFRALFSGGGTNSGGLFRWNAGTTELLYETGGAVPVDGYPGDAVFGNFLDTNRDRLVVNTRGDIVFAGSVSGTGISGTGLFYRTHTGELLELAFGGRAIDPINAPAFVVTGSIASNGLPVNQPLIGGSPECGRPHQLNEKGVFAARIRQIGSSNERWLLFTPFTLRWRRQRGWCHRCERHFLCTVPAR